MLTSNALIRDRYLIVRQISGASVIYEALDLTTRTHVALKQVALGTWVEEFERDARLLRGLRHPNLPVLNDYFVEGDSGFLVMDLVPGDKLAAALERNRAPFSMKQLLVWADQLLDALNYIHTLQPLNGEVSYRLELDGTVLETPAIVLRDFLDRKTVQGVQREYDYTSRVASDAAGAYTRMRAEPDVVSQSGAMLRNGDEVEILSADRDGWYLARIHTSGDASQIGAIGWVELWLVDNEDVPPSPTPAPKPQPLAFVGRVYSTPTDKAVQCGTSFASSIYGSVGNSTGRGIAGAAAHHLGRRQE